MARRKSFRKRYNKNKQKNIAKNYSKKVERKIYSRKRKAAGFPWFSRRALIHPNQSVPHAPVPPVPVPVPVPPAPAPVPVPVPVPLAYPIALPVMSPVSAKIIENSAIIKLIAIELESIYSNSPEIFDYIAEAFMEFSKSDPFQQRYSADLMHSLRGNDIYNPYITIYINRVQPYIQNLPKTEHFDENSALRIMNLLHSASTDFLNTMISRMHLIDGFLTQTNNNKLQKFMRLLNNLVAYSHPDQYRMFEY
jgi:hypothetical protein